MHHIHPHGWRNKSHPQTKQSRKTLRRRARQERQECAYAQFQRDFRKFKDRESVWIGDFPPWHMVPPALKLKIMEKYG